MMERENHTTATEFFLQGLVSLHKFQLFLFTFFLSMFVLSVAGNSLIVLIILLAPHLHTPMYFFLGNLSFVEDWYVAVTVPKALDGLLTHHSLISVTGCITQSYFFFALGGTECFLLTAMAYDRHAVICHPPPLLCPHGPSFLSETGGDLLAVRLHLPQFCLHPALPLDLLCSRPDHPLLL
ncbi:olfactory receptor 7A10-like [Ornithorhynchus anatinus]|uniref:olfactory receptor 7A10-like n=1 Tax=Ornithorhynchus anatinus TaxID=9258 RepID=UPI0010A7A3F9|nr:olfactory receptor 7A10-like [Ornithorhynchus anatinus]